MASSAPASDAAFGKPLPGPGLFSLQTGPASELEVQVWGPRVGGTKLLSAWSEHESLFFLQGEAPQTGFLFLSKSSLPARPLHQERVPLAVSSWGPVEPPWRIKQKGEVGSCQGMEVSAPRVHFSSVPPQPSFASTVGCRETRALASKTAGRVHSLTGSWEPAVSCTSAKSTCPRRSRVASKQEEGPLAEDPWKTHPLYIPGHSPLRVWDSG